MKKAIAVLLTGFLALTGGLQAAGENADCGNTAGCEKFTDSENAVCEDAAEEETEWEFVSLGFFPDVPAPANWVDVYGFKFGIPVSFGEDAFVAGVEASFGASMTKEIYGVQTAPFFTSSDLVEGLQFSIVNVARDVYGLQLGVVNYSDGSTMQLGIINIIKGSPLPFMIGFNCCYEL